ncbi:MAG: hypothetical protein Q9192_006154, partial [Flavoplaca navasiana]
MAGKAILSTFSPLTLKAASGWLKGAVLVPVSSGFSLKHLVSVEMTILPKRMNTADDSCSQRERLNQMAHTLSESALPFRSRNGSKKSLQQWTHLLLAASYQHHKSHVFERVHGQAATRFACYSAWGVSPRQAVRGFDAPDDRGALLWGWYIRPEEVNGYEKAKQTPLHARNLIKIEKMKPIGLIPFTLLGSWTTNVLSLGDPVDVAVLERAHSRAIIKRAGRDCGIFQMDCVNAAGACNNACYYKNCINPNGYKMVYDATNTDERNRAQSGCTVGGVSICNQLPFSQVFHDPQNKIPGDTSVNCDEWPMATTKQTDFQPGTVRNSLRCIPGSENSSGGGQLSNWLLGDNRTGPKKTCPSPMQDGDYWNFQPGLTNASPV